MIKPDQINKKPVIVCKSSFVIGCKFSISSRIPDKEVKIIIKNRPIKILYSFERPFSPKEI